MNGIPYQPPSRKARLWFGVKCALALVALTAIGFVLGGSCAL